MAPIIIPPQGRGFGKKKKAQKWLKENVSKYLYNTGGRDEYIPACSGKMFEDFNNAMKEE